MKQDYPKLPENCPKVAQKAIPYEWLKKLDERQGGVLFYAMRRGFITRREYMEINKISHKTAHIELKDMPEKGFLTMAGKGRSVRYDVKR